MIDQYINRIINADCLDILRQLPDKCIDLVLTDPPYGIGVDKMTMFDGAKKQKRHKEYADISPSADVFKQIFRVSKNQIIFGGNYFADMLSPSRGWIVWDKKVNEKIAPYFSDCELAWTSFDRNIKKYTLGWYGVEGINNREESKIHPTQKPLPLFQWCLENYSKEGDLILDCFSGSGTTAVACHNLHRRFICIEKDPDYYRASVERLEKVQAQPLLF